MCLAQGIKTAEQRNIVKRFMVDALTTFGTPVGGPKPSPETQATPKIEAAQNIMKKKKQKVRIRPSSLFRSSPGRRSMMEM